VALPLASPRGVDDLYLARNEDISPARPILTGDVIAGVEIGVEHDGHVMIVAHPCSMRGAGGQLRPRIAAAPIRRYAELPLDDWPSGHFNVFPLPALFEHSQAVHLRELGTARRQDLAEAQRVACLSDYGIYLFQQRFVHSLTRVVVGIEQFEDATGHVLAEAELEEEWVERLADVDSAESIANQVAEFQAFLGPQMRSDLEIPERRSGVRRTVRQEISSREEPVAADPQP
jgi:hypothetical protein